MIRGMAEPKYSWSLVADNSIGYQLRQRDEVRLDRTADDDLVGEVAVALERRP